MSHANKIVNLVKNISNAFLESTVHTYIVYGMYVWGSDGMLNKPSWF